MTVRGDPLRRILVSATCYADARTALHLTRHLAYRRKSRIGGLLVEDPVLSALPRLERQRIITASGAMREVPDASKSRALFERDARAFEAALSELAATQITLRRSQGEITLAVWDAAQDWDILLLGQRETHPTRGRILLIAPEKESISDAADLARDLAQALGTTCLTLTLHPHSGSSPTETYADEQAMLARIRRTNCDAVVLDRTAGPMTSPEQVRQLLSAAHCPVVILNSDNGRT